jgi:hypothetical protein
MSDKVGNIDESLANMRVANYLALRAERQANKSTMAPHWFITFLIGALAVSVLGLLAVAAVYL